ncbi:hypothetical protein BDV95DRAFT_622092 [Massariosphaeria phaeospora]|uniref:Rhodopsin domain-containing protein n=1 Tax=Massariosphaeria phaeospora TaxID=100035 RepID=A0A7C8M466_9PLEO|nr:hypothetical protein BDV95DRAFT_622092 [Massariosphaeria phaeospora]
MRITPTGPALNYIIVDSIFIALTCVVIALRLWGRLRLRTIGLDDWLMFLGFLMSQFSNVAVFVAINHGGGARAYRISHWDGMQARKFYLFGSINYTISIIPMKTSICVQLLRLTARIKPVYAYVLYATMGVTICASVIRVIVWTTRCKPFAAAWNPALGTCGDPNIVLHVSYFFSAICILTDWMSLKKKLQVGFVLSLGFLASIATCVRFKYLTAYVDPKEYLYGLPDMGIWSGLETTLGMIAGSLPALRPLWRSLTDRSSSSTNKATGRRTGGLTHRLQMLKSSSRRHPLGDGDGPDNDVTYMGHVIQVSGGKDLERGTGHGHGHARAQGDSASQTHILGEERGDILMETQIEVKSERDNSSQEFDRKAST